MRAFFSFRLFSLIMALLFLAWPGISQAGPSAPCPPAPRAQAPFFERPPQLARAKDGVEWQQWYFNLGLERERRHGKLFIGGQEIPGATMNERRKTPLGLFVWRGPYDEKAAEAGLSGWQPEQPERLEPMESERPALLALDRLLKEPPFLHKSWPDPDENLAEDDILWLQWFHASFAEPVYDGGLHAALRLNGKWLVGQAGQRVFTSLGAFTYVGDFSYHPQGDHYYQESGWKSERKTLERPLWGPLPTADDFLPRLKDQLAFGLNLNWQDPQGASCLMWTALLADMPNHLSHYDDEAEVRDGRFRRKPPSKTPPSGLGYDFYGGLDQALARGAAGLPPLAAMALAGDLAEARRLIKNGALKKEKAPHGWTPLMWAAAGGSLELVRALLEAGAEPEAQDDYGWNALMWAVRIEANEELVRALIQAGPAALDARDKDGDTPLILAAKYNQDTRLTEVLVMAGINATITSQAWADPGIRNLAGETAYDYFKTIPDKAWRSSALGYLRRAAGIYPEPVISQALLDAGADVNAADENGDTPLIYATRENENPRVFRLLLNAGAKVDARNKKGQTALMLAARAFDPALVQTLLAAGANPNLADEDGYTALMYAIPLFKFKTVELLIQAGADPGAQNHDGRNALDIARLEGSKAVVEYLEKALAEAKN